MLKSTLAPASMSRGSKVNRLRDRAKMLAAARAFFASRGVMEVDCPIVTRKASVDVFIDLIQAVGAFQGKRYLHSSPEYGMKRLLSEGIGDIYQLSHVFRDSEIGPYHNPEFTLAEWYRLGFSFSEMMQETADFIRLFLGELPSECISYRQALQAYAGIDYAQLEVEDLLQHLEQRQIIHQETDKDALLNIILGVEVEPHLGEEQLTILNYYPSTQAALAKTTVIDGVKVAERFEIYYRGRELANGYCELTDAKEQRLRFEAANHKRQALRKEPLPIDEDFIAALESGVPFCCGVAVGFDRLMMLRGQCAAIAEVLPFSWQEA